MPNIQLAKFKVVSLQLPGSWVLVRRRMDAASLRLGRDMPEDKVVVCFFSLICASLCKSSIETSDVEPSNLHPFSAAVSLLLFVAVDALWESMEQKHKSQNRLVDSHLKKTHISVGFLNKCSPKLNTIQQISQYFASFLHVSEQQMNRLVHKVSVLHL